LEPAEYDYMFQLEDTLWWFVAMRRIVRGLIDRHLPDSTEPRRCLDAGCGTGANIPFLEPYGEVSAFDFYPPAVELCLKRRKGRVAVASIDAVPYADESFDLVTALDVVCQLPSPGDQQSLNEMARIMKPGGLLVVRTPAFQWLYGPFDQTLHTAHRYTTGEMAAKMRAAGLTPVQETYANTLLFPVALVRRMLTKLQKERAGHDSDVRAMPGPVNAALQALLSLEAPVVSRMSLPVGLSSIVVAKKP